MRKILLISLFLSLFSGLQAYTDVPVLVRIDKSEQHDTMGFNLVKEIPCRVYDAILAGELKLWDSPAKEVQIQGFSLLAIEKSAGVRFCEVPFFFSHEIWSSGKKTTEFIIAGLSFNTKDKNGKPLSFGFVDVAGLESVLKKAPVNVNLNGSYGINAWEALMSRHYEFNVLQFGRKTFTGSEADIKKALEIRNEAFNNQKIRTNAFVLPEKKWVISKTVPENQPVAFEQFCQVLSRFFKDNGEELYNLGGDRFLHFSITQPEVSITGFEIVEIWERRDGQLVVSPQQIIIYVNNHPLDPISLAQLEAWQLTVNFRNAALFLQAKQYNYQILSINDIPVLPADSDKYRQVLTNYSWTQITEFLKYQ